MRDIEVKTKFVELRAEGFSFQKISDQLNVSKPTLICWSRELAQDIKNLRTMYLEELREKHGLLIEHRNRSFGEMLKKMGDELKNRDLSGIPTDKLADIYLRYIQAAGSETQGQGLELEATVIGELKDVFSETVKWSA